MPPPIKYLDGLKICRACGITKPLSDYYAVKARDGAPSGRCKACINHARPPYKRLPVSAKECLHCGVSFTPKKRPEQTKFCSTRCAQTAWARGKGIGPAKVHSVVIDGRKQCTRCGEWKFVDQYGRRTNRPAGVVSQCRACLAEQSRRYHGGDRGRDKRYAKKYGVTIEWYDATMTSQGGGCAICGSPPDSGSKVHPRLAIDHDHQTGRPRALLCFICNSVLGKFRDDPDLLRRAAEYIEHHRTAT